VGREYCDADVLRQLRRRSLAMLRREVEPVEPDAYARFIQAWHGIPGERRGVDSLVEALAQLQGAALAASALESELLPARLRTYRAADLDELCTTGDVIWVGSGGIGPSDGRIRLYFADQFALLDASLEPAEPPTGPLHDALRAHLSSHGASFWNQLRSASADATDGELLAALWDLVWAGEVTNDSLAPLRAMLSGAKASRSSAQPRGRPRPGRLTRIGPPSGAGRWSLIAPQRLPAPSPTQAAHAAALQLLERYGVVTREAVLAEGVKGGYAATYAVLKVLEERGQVRRGYFVSGLGAAQFALPGAVDRLRSAREVADPSLHPELVPAPVVLSATDPAQPYGAALDWPESPGRASRTAGAVVVLRSGLPLAWFDRRSSHLVTFPESAEGSWAEALATLVKDGRQRSIEVRKVNGAPIERKGSEAAALLAAGFTEGYRGFGLRGT
jgi:ATP-dependent Lhr-like helicase